MKIAPTRNEELVAPLVQGGER